MMKKMNRRTFLKTTAVTAAMTTPIIASTLNEKDDYKALVCVLLEGGADTLSMVVPKNNLEAYSKQHELRGDVTPKNASLRTLVGSRYALHPQMPKMQRLYNYQNVAVVANVGTLIEPVTKEQLERNNSGVKLPLGLFSQMAQQNHWMMAGHTDKGWAGAVAEELAQKGTNVSVGGFSLMQHSNEYETLMAFDESAEVSLEEQLEKVATLISQRKESNAPKRQIFFVKHRGWNAQHKPMSEMQKHDDVMISELDNALDKFDRKIAQLKLAENVTTFTTFDSSRVTSSDNHGLNHGWGGHAFVMGGAVKAGIHGTMPNVASNSDDVMINTAVIPTTSSEQYLATMVEWLCDGKVDLNRVFPNLKNFEQKTLAFVA
jgi:uncharacterized protein (DUF1501 family)